MAEVGLAFLGYELVEEFAERVSQGGGGASSRRAKKTLSLRERQFDRVQVRAVGRQVHERCADSFNCFANTGLLWLERLSMITTSPG